MRNQTTGEKLPEHNPQVEPRAKVNLECERGVVVEDGWITHPMIGKRLRDNNALLELKANISQEFQRGMVDLVEEDWWITHQTTGEKTHIHQIHLLNT